MVARPSHVPPAILPAVRPQAPVPRDPRVTPHAAPARPILAPPQPAVAPRLQAVQPPVQPKREAYRPSSAVLQLARQVSYFSSRYSADARRYRRTHTVGGRNLATVAYELRKPNGKWGLTRYKTLPSAGLHSERRLYDYLEGLGQRYRVKWVYTELEPCGSDYHNCAERLENWWPAARVYYSVDYPSYEDVSSDDSSDSDSEKERTKRTKAKRRRKRGPGTLKRFGTYLRKHDSDDEPDESDFKPTLTRINSPMHYSSGWEL